MGFCFPATGNSGDLPPRPECAPAWREHWPDVVPLPHQSPHNNLWIRRNPWFENELLPLLRARVAKVLEEDG
jgi:uracil-DNA glycosylase